MTTRNGFYLLAAFVVGLVSLLQRAGPLYLTVVEALVLTVVTAVPALAALLWRKPPHVSHGWTLVLALVLAFGRQYSASR